MTPEKIKTAIVDRLQEVFPGETVYTDLTPRDFERPSNLVELVKLELDALTLGSGTVQIRYSYKITTFCETDAVHDSHLPVLDLRAMSILAAFAEGYIRVADRAPKVTTCTADTSLYDAAEVTLVLTLTIDRAEFRPDEAIPMMRLLHTKQIVSAPESPQTQETARQEETACLEEETGAQLHDERSAELTDNTE
jgi:hypothetical protein